MKHTVYFIFAMTLFVGNINASEDNLSKNDDVSTSIDTFLNIDAFSFGGCAICSTNQKRDLFKSPLLDWVHVDCRRKIQGSIEPLENAFNLLPEDLCTDWQKKFAQYLQRDRTRRFNLLSLKSIYETYGEQTIDSLLYTSTFDLMFYDVRSYNSQLKQESQTLWFFELTKTMELNKKTTMQCNFMKTINTWLRDKRQTALLQNIVNTNAILKDTNNYEQEHS